MNHPTEAIGSLAIGVGLATGWVELNLQTIPAVQRILLPGISGGRGAHLKQETPIAVSIFSKNVTCES